MMQMKKLLLPPDVNGVKKTVAVEDNVYTLTFGKNGSVKVSLAKADKPTKAIASGSATLSIVGYASGEWKCELCTSLVVKKNDYGAVCIFRRDDIGGRNRDMRSAEMMQGS